MRNRTQPIPDSGELSPALRDRLAVILVHPRNPLNIGAVARAMSNFGINDLRLVEPYDVAYQNAKSAVNADHVLLASREFGSLREALQDCSLSIGATGIEDRSFEQPLRRLERAGGEIRGSLEVGRVALIFGSEKHGLSNSDLSFCHWLLHIPTRPEHDSMNLGQAVAIAIYEVIRNESQQTRRPKDKLPADEGALSRLHAYLLGSMRLSGFIKPLAENAVSEKTRILLHRLNISAHDAVFWQGVFRQIEWALINSDRRKSDNGDKDSES
jgi:tRNA/rRNA methyltransferase